MEQQTDYVNIRKTDYVNSAFTPTSAEEYENSPKNGNLKDFQKIESNNREIKIKSDTLYQELSQGRKADLYESLFSAKLGTSSTELIQQTSEENENCEEYDNTLPREGPASYLELINDDETQQKAAQLTATNETDESLFSAKSGAGSANPIQQTSEELRKIIDYNDYDYALPREGWDSHLQLTNSEKGQGKLAQRTETANKEIDSSEESGRDLATSIGPSEDFEASDQSNVTDFSISERNVIASANSEGVGSWYEFQEEEQKGKNEEIPISNSTRAANETNETFEIKTPNIHTWPGNRLGSCIMGFTFVLALITFLLVVLLIFGKIGPKSIDPQLGGTCDGFMKHGVLIRGQLDVIRNGKFFSVYCDGNGWTLVAKFSNTDLRSWMRTDGSWWYDTIRPQGKYNVPSSNADGISSAFWLLGGNEFKITRTDDPSHTALLQTTSNCLGGMTFREKVTSYGNFRDEVVWANNSCGGSCDVLLDGEYSSTEGFQQAKCNSVIGGASKISFWCDWRGGDGAVMMIGGGGDFCGRADHGIGVTEENEAKFVSPRSNRAPDYNDFGNNGYTTFNKYGLNLWVR